MKPLGLSYILLFLLFCFTTAQAYKSLLKVGKPRLKDGHRVFDSNSEVDNFQHQKLAPPLPDTLAPARTSSVRHAEIRQAPGPTIFPNSTLFDYAGCYNELPPEASTGALGPTGSYFSPILASADALTVPICLSACGYALGPNETLYLYAAVENGRDCYCSQTLSPASVPHDTSFCSLSCPGDTTTICGGWGYLALYTRRSSPLSSTTTSPSPSDPTETIASITPISSNTTTPTTTDFQPEKTFITVKRTTLYIGIAFASLGAVAIGILLGWYCRNQIHRRQGLLFNSTNTKQEEEELGWNEDIYVSEKARRTLGLGEEGGGRRGEDDILPMIREERKRRDTYEFWKGGSVPVSSVVVRGVGKGEGGRRRRSMRGIISMVGARRRSWGEVLGEAEGVGRKGSKGTQGGDDDRVLRGWDGGEQNSDMMAVHDEGNDGERNSGIVGDALKVVPKRRGRHGNADLRIDDWWSTAFGLEDDDDDGGFHLDFGTIGTEGEGNLFSANEVLLGGTEEEFVSDKEARNLVKEEGKHDNCDERGHEIPRTINEIPFSERHPGRLSGRNRVVSDGDEDGQAIRASVVGLAF